MELPVRLPKQIRPSKYRIDLELDPSRDDYRGEVTIALEVSEPTSVVELHAVGLSIESATLGDAPAKFELLPDRERLRITAAKALVGSTSLILRFGGTLQRGLRGLYKVVADDRAFAFTQFEPADARRAFPCFDEPALKAVFESSVTIPKGLDALSNGALTKIDELPDGRRKFQFAPTPVLSTYLVAFAVGEFGAVSAKVGEVPVRVLAVPGKEKLGALALEMACAFLPILENYFGIPYPYGKLDLLAAPDFEAGAMENAGAIFFRESLLLLDGATASLDAQRQVAITVAHEMAHQWFGNLVTMEWWDDLWLNEAFATWMEFKVVDAWRPDWELWTDFERMKAVPLHLDSLQSTRPIQAAVRSPEQANEMFDGITYNKGAAVLRMFEIFLGEEKFREGVRHYLRDYAGRNAQASALWAALKAASGQPVDALAQSWFTRPGYPLLSMAAEGGSLRISQHRFFAKPGYREEAAPWAIPLAVVAEDGGPKRVTRLLETADGELPLPGPLVFGNAQGSGFYRVSYEASALAAIIGNADRLAPVERVSLLADQWAQVRAGAPLGPQLDLIDRLARLGSAQRTVMETVFAQLATLDDVVVTDAARPKLQAWIHALLVPPAKELGIDPAAGEGPQRQLLRPRLFETLVKVGDDDVLRSLLQGRLDRWLEDGSGLSTALVGVALRLAAQRGDAALWEKFRSRMLAARGPEEHDRFLVALGAFETPDLVERSLALSLTDDVRAQDLQILLGQLFSNRPARRATWSFVTSRWVALAAKAPVFGLRRIVSATAALSDRELRAQVESFFGDPAHHVEAGERELRQALEAIDLALDLRSREQDTLAAWLAKRPA